MNDNPYEALALDTDDQRWAFGSGFADPLEGLDTSVPDGVDADALAATCLALGDDALIYSHRLQQWITRLPELEDETAVANIALDLLGQARMLLTRAGRILGRTDDDLAFLRTEEQFRCVRLVERADADFAELVARLVVLSSWRLEQAAALATVADPVLAAIAAKSIPELTYHREYAAQWVVRLGDGTTVSHARMQAGLDVIWPLVGELFDAADLVEVPRTGFDAVLDTVLAAAGLARPERAPLARIGGRTGRDGVHTEALGVVLAELQSVARAYPGATW